MMNLMDMEFETVKLPVLVLDKKPEINDKWESLDNIYTVTSVKNTSLEFVGEDGYLYWQNVFFDVNVSVWNKLVGQETKSQYFLVKVDEYRYL